MTHEAVLNQLGLIPNEALLVQLENIEKNTHGYEKIIKHIMDLHEALKTCESYVALSNSNNYFKIKVDATSDISKAEAKEKINHFSEKFKVEIQKVQDKATYYILGFDK
jgi:capsular polysaccharide biosynthesis protein